MMTLKKIALLGAVPMLLLAGATPAISQTSATEIKDAVAFRQETLARSIGLLAYQYAYPAVDYYRIMYEQTTPGRDPAGAYAPVNRFYNFGKLTEPAGPVAGRSPNADTVYFQAWVDLRNGPLIIKAPDTAGRYYNLDYVDFKSETDAHTGRRTTGTKAQTIYLVGPTWQGTPPPGMILVRMKTELGLVFGRVLVTGQADLKAVNALINQFSMAEAPGTAAPEKRTPISGDTLYDMDFFVLANRFLRETAPVAGEEALMEQFDSIGVGPKSTFDPAKISDATRRGLMKALEDGRRVVEQGRYWDLRGWTAVKTKIGVYGFDYFSRAAIERSGLLANAPEEAVYPRYRADMAGNLLDGTRRYKIVVPKDMPVDAFWSITAYGNDTRDLMPNPAKIYGVGDRDPKLLKRQKDGSAVVLIQADKPSDPTANWLPVERKAFYIIFRLYQPQPRAFDPGYKLPDVQMLSEK